MRVRPFEPAAQQDHVIGPMRQQRHQGNNVTNNGDRSAEAGGGSGVVVKTITHQMSSSCVDETTQQLTGKHECLKVRAG